ncbi:MAG: lipid-A-disaccharide synthase [Planctomycetota bacterium]|jgi:lipid-A-disaccharide synthase
MGMPRRVFLSAGEASGDLHAANLVRALRDHWPETEFVGFGGPRMEEAGVALREDLVESSVMGFGPVLRALGRILGTVARFEEEMRRTPPDLLIVVDYPGMNGNLARLARRHGVPVACYICPQVWAWCPWRIHRYARHADLLLPILPFEEEIFSAVHPRVRYVGSPVIDHLEQVEGRRGDAATRVFSLGAQERLLALLPGSREQEVREIAAVQLRAAAEVVSADPRWRPVISCQRPALERTIRAAIAEVGIAVELHAGSPHDLQREADLALVCSGTATLETGWYGTPMVVLYAASELERELYREFSVAPHFALVNLCAGEEVVPEVLFGAEDDEALRRSVRSLLPEARRGEVSDRLRRLRGRLRGGASEAAAREIVSLLGAR